LSQGILQSAARSDDQELCPACPRETPEAYFAIEWGPFGWTIVDQDGNTYGTPRKNGYGVYARHFKTGEAAHKKAESLLRKRYPDGVVEFAINCGQCPFQKQRNKR
jgi:hypothetical protein